MSNRTVPAGWPEDDPAHPRSLAKLTAHRAHCTGSHQVGEVICPAVIDPAVERELWSHRGRMAAARRAAGVTLDRADRQALDRAEGRTRA